MISPDLPAEAVVCRGRLSVVPNLNITRTNSVQKYPVQHQSHHNQ